MQHIFIMKSEINTPLLKRLHINIKEQYRSVNEASLLCNLTPSISIMCTKYTMFMPAYCLFSTNNPIYFILFPSPLRNMEKPFLFVNINFFFLSQLFFVSLLLLVVLVSISVFSANV